MACWLLVSLALLALVALFAPYQLPVSLYKLSLITSAAWVAYWIDRGLFPYARPHQFLQYYASPATPGMAVSTTLEQTIAFAASMLRRAILIAAAMIGVALGA
tara:strand:- start:668 stop:976 length:309 start_codon:yes stop_codon:yes gene_type:complete